MSLLSRNNSRRSVFLALLLVLTILSWSLPVRAAGGFAMSGSFYAQEFELPQGSSLKSHDVYVVIFNNTDSDFNVRLTPDTPLEVKLILAEYDFSLKVGQQKKVEIGIEVGQDAIPGEYEISITAEPYVVGATGIRVVGAASQSAQLTITGEAALVQITAVNPGGEPLPAMIRLFRITEGKSFDIGLSETGSLKATVSPGSYNTSAFVAGQKVAEESFDISANEEREIRLTVKTVYFEGFGIGPNYSKDTGKLAMAKIVYAVNNLLQSFPQAEVRLKVSHDNAPLDEATLVNLSPLEKGKMELSYNYIPAEGWQQGIYRFKLELNMGGEVYTTSLEKELEVTDASGANAGNSSNWPVIGDILGSSFNWLLIAGIFGVVVLLTIIIIVLARRRTY